MSSFPKIVVGTFTYHDEFKSTEYFETASWKRVLRIPAGTYPVEMYYYPTDGRAVGSQLYIFAMKGECIHSYFEAKLFGHRSSEVDKDVGTVYDHSVRIPSYGSGL